MRFTPETIKISSHSHSLVFRVGLGGMILQAKDHIPIPQMRALDETVTQYLKTHWPKIRLQHDINPRSKTGFYLDYQFWGVDDSAKNARQIQQLRQDIPRLAQGLGYTIDDQTIPRVEEFIQEALNETPAGDSHTP
jgi:hypothetical protein